MPRKNTMGRAANGSGSIRKKTKTQNGKTYVWWEARITTGYDPGTGKQIQRSVSGKKKEDVAKKSGNYQLKLITEPTWPLQR